MHRTFCLIALAIFFTFATQAAANATSQEHYSKGIRLSQQKLWQDAAVEFGKAVSLDPKFALAHANQGVALSQLGKHKDALLAFEAALQLGYDEAQLRYNRGVSFARLHLLEEAATELEMAVKGNSRLVKAYYDLGLVYVMQKRNQDAKEQVTRLYRKNNKLAKKLFDQIPHDYKVTTVNNGGSLTGRVRLTGPIPKVRSFHLIHAPNIEFCSRISDGKGHRLLFDFTVSENRGLKDTIIALQEVKHGKPFPATMQKFNISRCHSDQYVIGVRNSENIMIENTDPIQHEIATYEFNPNFVKQRSNKPVIPMSSQVRDAFVRHDSHEFVIKCNLHPFLQTRGFMVDNPYYAKSDAEGNFSLDGIPPGTYEVVAWHPFISNQTGTVTITAGGETKLDFEFDGNNVRRKLYHDDLEGYRFNTWFDSHEKFYGGERIDDPIEQLQKF
jgi:tetratricopeptide (TPR) repeat protein